MKAPHLPAPYGVPGGEANALDIHSPTAGTAHITPDRMNTHRCLVRRGTAAAPTTVINRRPKKRGHRGAIHSGIDITCASTGNEADMTRPSAGKLENWPSRTLPFRVRSGRARARHPGGSWTRTERSPKLAHCLAGAST